MLRSFLAGVGRASRSWWIILLLLAVNLLVALPIVTPIFVLIVQTTSHRQAAETMISDTLDPYWLADFINQQLSGESLASVGGQFGALLLVMGISSLLLNTLFAGGVLEVFANDERFTMRRFWAGCGAYFWRFFRLLLISLLFYGLAYLIYFLVSIPIDSAKAHSAAFTSVFYKRWMAIALLVLLFSLVNMIFDYARIGAVVGARRRMFRESIGATRFALRNFFGAYSLYWLIGLIGLGGFALLAWLRAAVPQTSGIEVVLAILLAQLAMAVRMWTRLAFYAAELDLYRRLTPPPQMSAAEPFVPVEAREPEYTMEDPPALPGAIGEPPLDWESGEKSEFPEGESGKPGGLPK